MIKAPADRRSSGFTVLEAMITIAILVIIMAIAFPVVSTLQKNLKMNELDAAARHIFIAAQNQLVSLRASGDTGGFSAHTLSGEPSDYSGTDWTTLTYLGNTDATISKLLPTGAIEPKLASGYYIIEFDRSTGAIYGVFYSEESFTYDTGAIPRDRETRKSTTPLIGYYGGAVLEGRTIAALPNPQVTVTNGETLTVSMTTSNPFTGTVTDGYFFSDLTYLVTLRSTEDPTKSITFSTDAIPTKFSGDLYGDPYTYTLLLDSLTAGSHFSELCPDIVPGDNLTVTVTVSYDGSGGETLPSSTVKTTNSLFAGRSGNAVTVAYARHLQNLEHTVSGVSTVTSAEQTASIDWSYYSSDFIPISNSELTSYDGSGLTIANLKAGANDGNSGLFGKFSGDTLANIRLIDAVVSDGTNSGGLAGLCENAVTITGCGLYVTDLGNVSGYIISGIERVGGLVGSASAALNISDCFAAPARIYGGSYSTYMGGLVGYCGAGSRIERCYADTDVDSDASPDLGGLIGHCGDGSTVTDCYALGNLSSIGSLHFGGLVGGSLTTDYANCYAAPTFDGTGGYSTPYGFAGSLSNDYDNCACLQSSGFADSDPTADFAPITYSVLQAWDGGGAWTAASAANSHPYDTVLTGTAYPFPRLVALEHYNDWPDKLTLPTVTSFAYYETYGDGTTGYYATDSNGRVAVNTLSNAKGPVTFDGYCMLSIGDLANRSFVFETASGDVEDWLADKGNVTFTMDGESMTYHVYEIPRYVLLNSNYDISNFYIYVKNMGNTYWYNPHFAKAAVNGSATRPVFSGTAIVRTTRQLAAIGSNIYTAYLGDIYTFRQEIDLDFAVYDGTDAYDVVTIGTSDQYFQGVYDGHGYDISLNSDASHNTVGLFGYTSGTIRDINLYTSATDPYTIGSDSYPSGVLCGTNTGTVDNCIITFGTSYAIQGAPYGTVAGSNTGTVTNCLVTGSGAVTLNNGYGHVGGFVGSNGGTVTDCFVRPGVSTYAGFTVTGHFAAGFVYSNSGTIEACSVTGVVTGEGDSSRAAGFAYDNTGAIASCYSNCLVTGFSASGFAFTSSASGATIQNCYSMVKVTCTGGYGIRAAAGFVYSGNTGISNCYTVCEVTGYATYTFTRDLCGADCYYLSWTGCGYNATGTGLSMTGISNAFAGDTTNWGGADTHVYLDQYDDLVPPCPYPLLTGLDHYGDWLDEEYYVPPTPMLAYYEKYSDSSYGYYALKSDGSTELYNTLSDSKGAVTGDGYVMLSPLRLTDQNFTVQTSGGDYTFWCSYDTVTLDYHGNSETFYRYCFPSWVYSHFNYSSADFYQYAVIDGTTYWYNPHFAKAAVNGAASIPSFGGTAYIRATRQLAALGNSSYAVYWGSGFTFRQELDLDFTTYSCSIPSPTGTSSGSPFAGTYNGGGHTILLNSNAKNNKNALFGYSTGTLQNICISNSGSFTMGSWGSPSGILSATNTGNIQNCSITFASNFTMTGTPFGTIAGRNSGTITNCLVTSSAAVTLSCGSNTGAGFVGENGGTVSNCCVRPGTAAYAGLTLNGTSQISGFVYTNSGTVTDCSVTGSVGANSWGAYVSGFVYTNTGAVTRCYANCLVTGYNAVGFAYTSTAAGASIQNCYSMLRVSADIYGGYAAGFAYEGSSGISDCYTAAQVLGYRTYTFSHSGTIGADCYYLDGSGCGDNVTGTGLSSSALISAFDDDAVNWGGADTHVYQDQYTGLPSACPYPLITGLDHYGDWIPAASSAAIIPLTYQSQTLGVLYYEKQPDGTYFVTGASVQYGTSSKGLTNIGTDSSFFSDYYDLSDYLYSHTLPNSGYGVFWSADADIRPFSINGTSLTSLDTYDDMNFNSNYYAIPYDNASVIRYTGSKPSRDWTVTFDYDPAANTFTVTE